MILAINGTTGTTCPIIDADGRVLRRAVQELTQFFPRQGWVENA